MARIAGFIEDAAHAPSQPPAALPAGPAPTTRTSQRKAVAMAFPVAERGRDTGGSPDLSDAGHGGRGFGEHRRCHVDDCRHRPPEPTIDNNASNLVPVATTSRSWRGTILIGSEPLYVPGTCCLRVMNARSMLVPVESRFASHRACGDGRRALAGRAGTQGLA